MIFIALGGAHEMNNSLPWCVGVLIKEVSKGNKEIYVKIRYWDKKRIMS